MTPFREPNERRRAIVALESAGDRVQAEWNIVRERLDALEAIISMSSDAIITSNMEGFIVSVNPAAMTMFGYEEQEMLGMAITVIMPKRYREKHTASMEHLKLTGEGPMMGKRLGLFGLHKDGREFPIEVRLSAWQTGAGRFVAAVLREQDESTKG